MKLFLVSFLIFVLQFHEVSGYCRQDILTSSKKPELTSTSSTVRTTTGEGTTSTTPTTTKSTTTPFGTSTVTTTTETTTKTSSTTTKTTPTTTTSTSTEVPTTRKTPTSSVSTTTLTTSTTPTTSSTTTTTTPSTTSKTPTTEKTSTSTTISTLPTSTSTVTTTTQPTTTTATTTKTTPTTTASISREASTRTTPTTPTTTTLKPTDTASSASISPLASNCANGYPLSCEQACGCPMYTVDYNWTNARDPDYYFKEENNGKNFHSNLTWNDCVPTLVKCVKEDVMGWTDMVIEYTGKPYIKNNEEQMIEWDAGIYYKKPGNLTCNTETKLWSNYDVAEKSNVGLFYTCWISHIDWNATTTTIRP